MNPLFYHRLAGVEVYSEAFEFEIIGTTHFSSRLQGIVDDFYLNLLDWGVRNVVAVALGGNLFLWNAQTGTIEHLIELPNQQVG